MRRAWRRSARILARVVLPTRRGPSMTMKRGSCGLRGGGVVAGHRWMSPRQNRVSAAIIADSRTELSARVRTLEAGRGRARKVQMFSLLWPIYGLVLPVGNGQTEGLQECTN